MANRDYENRRYLGDDRERWGARERDLDDGYRGGDLGPRQERGPWQGGQGYSGGGFGRGFEDYGRNPREDMGRSQGFSVNDGYGRPPSYPSYSTSPGNLGGSTWSERDLGYDRGYDRGFGTYVARDRSDGLHDRRDFDERGPLARFGDRLREGVHKLGKGPKTYTRSDDRVREDICDRLMHGWVNAEDVEVQVKSGEVTLTGFVDERRDKRVIEDIVEDVLGVKDVHNQLKVGRPEMLGAAPTGTPGTPATKLPRS